jgi:hypothetical protein
LSPYLSATGCSTWESLSGLRTIRMAATFPS